MSGCVESEEPGRVGVEQRAEAEAEAETDDGAGASGASGAGLSAAVASVGAARAIGLPKELVVESSEAVGLTDAELAAGLVGVEVLRAQLDGFAAGLVAEAVRRGLPERSGEAGPTEWVRAQCGVGVGDARAVVELAQVVDVVPEAVAALGTSGVRAGHVRALARAIDDVGAEAVAEAGEGLWGKARKCRPEPFARRVRRWVIAERIRQGMGAREAVRAERRLSERVDHARGIGTLVAELPVDDHAVVLGVVRAIAEELWRAEHGEPTLPDATLPDATVPDADPDLDPETAGLGAGRSWGQRMADALVEMARRAATVPVSERGRTRPLVLVGIDYDDLLDGLGRTGTVLGEHTPLDAATVRRLACDADLVPVVLGGPSQPLDLGRSRRLASEAQRRAMLARSDHCEWPDCDTRWEWCDAHHLTPWEQGGATDLDQLAWLCRDHHHEAHEGGWTVTRNANGTLDTQPPTASDPTATTPAGKKSAGDESAGKKPAGSRPAGTSATNTPVGATRSAGPAFAGPGFAGSRSAGPRPAEAPECGRATSTGPSSGAPLPTADPSGCAPTIGNRAAVRSDLGLAG